MREFIGKEYKIEVGVIETVFTPAPINENYKDYISNSTENKLELKKYLKDDYLKFCDWLDTRVKLYKEIK